MTLKYYHAEPLMINEARALAGEDRTAPGLRTWSGEAR